MPVHCAADASLHSFRCLSVFLHLPWWVRAPAVQGGTSIGSNLSLLGELGCHFTPPCLVPYLERD